MTTMTHCEGDFRFTDDTLPSRVLNYLARTTCPGCPIFDECAAGIEGDPYWVIRGGRVNQKDGYCRICGDPVPYRGVGRKSTLCYDHRTPNNYHRKLPVNTAVSA